MPMWSMNPVRGKVTSLSVLAENRGSRPNTAGPAVAVRGRNERHEGRQRPAGTRERPPPTPGGSQVEQKALERELAANGIAAEDFGLFTSLGLTNFDYEAAAPILVKWLARASDPILKEMIACALTGEKSAGSAATQALIKEFRNAPKDEDWDSQVGVRECPRNARRA
jgi:hypothetical protein